ncbi:S8 family serine peptidase [Paenibacillus sp. UNC217MF]|uniref:S8 family serine peptidase n=1 Tax=Paenibacillus sp. UNC217MF TaxID=1449062 RepID=UPI00056CC5DC|nr:S8 family serine peptidase [Paenibacillus sp. UNC217MF]
MKKKYRLLASLLCIFILIGTDITSALGSYYLNQEFTEENYSLLFDDLKLNHTVTNQENTSVSSATYGEQERQDNQESQEQERKPREPYLVGLKQGVTFDQFLNKPITKKRMMQSSPNTTKVETLPVANALLMHLNEVELTQLQNNPNISFIEPDSMIEVASTSVITKDHESYKFMPADTEITPWGVYSIGADLAQNNNLMGKGIKIGVIDTGISPHNDLDIVDGVSFVEGSSYIDDNGHGTHVSGTIAAKKNGAGVIGVAPEAELYAIKVLNSSGRGSYSQVIQGIEWAIEHDMNIINMSFGGMEYSKALHEAVQKAVDKGIIVVASAGNHGAGTETELYPALFPEVISVGAVTKAHKKANYSSVGSQINLVAPGSDILSTTKDGDYGVMSGTSMAAPHVTGALADIWAMDRQLSAEEVKQLAYDHATPLGEKHEYGVGLLNVAKSLGLIDQAIPVVNSLEEDNSVPEEQIPGDGVSIASYDHQGNNQTVNPGDMATVSLKLSDPKTLVYIGVFDPAGDKIIGDSRSNVPAGTAITFVWATSHLTVPGKYRIKYAYSGTDIVDNFYINVVDASSGLRSPANLSVSATETSIQLNWDRVSGAESYLLKLNGTLVDRTSNTHFRFTGLQPNMTYRLEVAAVNSNTTSSFSSISATTSGGANGAPATPTGLKAVSSSNSITLAWEKVTTATEYIVKKNGSVVGRTADTTYILKDLSNSTAYTLEVAASNSYGTSSYAVIHKTTGEDIPAPTGIKITAATKDAVTISWNSVPGAVAYSLRKNGTYETSITTTSYTFKNLTPNTSYTLEVASKNSSGELGEYASIKHNTANVLLPPSNLRITAATHNSLTLAWTSVNGATAYSFKKNGIYETSKTDTSHTFKDLKPNTQYKLEVASKKNDEVSDYASIFKTTLYPVPTDIIATNVTETSMRIVWNGTYGAQYSVRVNGVYWSTINSNYFTLDNLNPNTLYTIEVASKNGSGELSDYIKLSQKTLQDLVKPVVKMSLDTKEPYMINEELSFTLSATDNVKVAKTTMYVDFNGSRIKEQVVTSSKYSYTPRSVGSYRFTYEAVDTSGNTAAVSVNVTVDKKRDVVVFVPGFLGSEIVRGNSTLWPTYLTLDSLDLNDYGNPKDGSTFGSIIKYYNVPNPFNSKRDVAEEFINSLKDMGIEVVEAPYDWRRDLRNASSEISKYVDEAFRLSKGQRVTIVTHSTGGIVARHYLLTNPFAKEKVENFINLASPNLGTVRSIKGLVAGDTLGVSTGTFPFDIIRAKEMVQNMPAVYQLLPGKKFVDAYQNLYRNQFDFTSYYLDDYREGNIVNNYSELKKYISKNHNKFLYEDPESSNSFRYKIENYALDPSIKEYRIIAHGYQTITQFKKAKLDPYYGYGLDWKYRVLWGEGDDVVPILSANFNDMYNSTNYYTRSRHVGLITKEDKNDDSKNRGFYDSLKIIRNIVVDNRPPLENEFPRISNEQIKAHGIYFEAAGRLTAFDAKGNTAGFNSEGKFINEIPDLAYEVLDNSTFLFVPNGLKLSIKFEGSDTDNLNMGFTSYEGDIPGNSNIIEDVKMKKNSKVSFNFVGGQDNAGQTDILYDFNNNGSTEILHPSKEITAAEYFDTAAPVTTHTLSGTIKNDNWYVTPVTMTLHPTDDGGSGVSKTIYQINDGPEMEYTAPVEIKQNGVLEIKYYSIDKAENKEEKKSFTLKIDMEAPTVPENVRATHTSINSIGIEWNTSKDNLGYVKYQIFNYDKFIGETEENKFIIDNQLPNTDFSLVIKAVDKAGNESESNRFYTSTISTVPMLIAGEKNSAYVKTDRTLWMWGDNEFGQAGLGTTGGKASMAMKIANLENVIGVAVGSNHTLVLTQDGRVWSWGYGYYGQLGDKNRTYSTYPTPEKVPNLDSVVAVTAIGDYSMALKKDGTVWRWGGSSSGVEPQKLNFTGISAMAQGNPRSVGIVLKSDGTVWDLHGKQVQGLDGIVAISQGDGFSVALRNDGTVWTWGGNYYGQLGDGTTTNRDKPGMVKGLDEVEAISVGEYHVIAMKKDGSVWAWGDNREGQLGDGTKTNKLSPVQLAGIDAEGIAAGNNYGMALQKNGIVWSWGNNSFAQLGDGTIEGRTVPVQVKENQTLKAILRYPAGTQNTPDKSNVTLPSIGWNIEGAWLAPFGNYQVQILDETGKILVDSGIQKRYVDVTNTQGSWVLTTPLEANKIVQVRVKVSDGSLWSEWSEPGWMKYELPEMQATLEP